MLLETEVCHTVVSYVLAYFLLFKLTALANVI